MIYSIKEVQNMLKIISGILIGLILGCCIGGVFGYNVNHPIRSTPVINNEIIQESDCSLETCQELIQDAYYTTAKTKHCLDNPDKIECMN